jgi:energy-coupling factor transporter ATP-binding protein EcfA2
MFVFIFGSTFFFLDLKQNVTMKLKIRKFDMKTMPPDAVVLLVGKRGTGKSTLLKDICYNVKDQLHCGIACCPTEDSVEGSDGLSSFIPGPLIHDSYKPQVVEKLLNYQKKSVKKYGKEKTKRQFIILDDCCYDKKILKGTELRQLAMNGRHRRLFFINAIQYLCDLSPDIRTNVDIVFCLKENILSNKERLWKHFFGCFPDFTTFCQTMDALTSNFGAMVLNNRSRSTKLEDQIFHYTADHKLPQFQMCHPVFWKLSKSCAIEEKEGDEESEEDSNEGGKSRKVFIKKIESLRDNDE